MTEEEHWALWKRDPRATPFQSPAWLNAWWRHLGGGERIDVEARDPGGQLIGALPLFVWNDRGARTLVPVGAGHSDYCDALVDPRQEQAAMAALWQQIAESSERWDKVLLPDLRPTSPLLGAAPPGWEASDEPAEICPVLQLLGEGPLASVPPRQRRKVAQNRHRAQRLGNVRTALATAGELPEALDALFALHAKQWTGKGETGVLGDARIQAFHCAAAPALQQAGLLRCILVRHEERIVAVLYALADRSRFHPYIGGVDMSLPGQSFGTLAFARLIEAAAEEGASELHFLRGEEAYKYAWGADPCRTFRRIMLIH